MPATEGRSVARVLGWTLLACGAADTALAVGGSELSLRVVVGVMAMGLVGAGLLLLGLSQRE